MLSTISCLLFVSLASAQQGDLQIVNARGTYGYLGATRKPTGVIPGETVHFAFDIKGMKQDANGRVFYRLVMEVLDSGGDKVFQLPRKSTAQNFLGGDTIPCHAQLVVPADSTPGNYTLRITIEDQKTKKKAVFEKKGKVIDPDFHLVNIGTFNDSAGKQPVPPVGTVGELLYIGFSAIGFKRDATTKQPNLELSLMVFDDKGKPTMAQPLKGSVTDGVAEQAKLISPRVVGLTLTRLGRFTVELRATDKLAGKTSTVRLPVHVLTSP